VGVGWNVNNTLAQAPLELAEIVTTLRDLLGAELDRAAILREFLSRFDTQLATLARDPEAVGRRGDQLCLQRGQMLTVESGAKRMTGQCAGIAPDGALLLDTPSGRQAQYAGTVSPGKALGPV
jgi:biotin-(acetyl-CoA carboxylase) ligase